jgi:hypothetical protein
MALPSTNMKIKRKNLLEWVEKKETIRYKGELYKAQYNGREYFLLPIPLGDIIPFYHKGRGIYGLETNKN